MKLSEKQQEAYDRAKQAEGLRYVRGGYWVEATVDPEAFLAMGWQNPARPWHTTTQTVQALVRRGLLTWTDTTKGYPTAAGFISQAPGA